MVEENMDEEDWMDTSTRKGISEEQALINHLLKENTQLKEYIEARRTDLLG